MVKPHLQRLERHQFQVTQIQSQATVIDLNGYCLVEVIFKFA